LIWRTVDDNSWRFTSNTVVTLIDDSWHWSRVETNSWRLKTVDDNNFWSSTIDWALTLIDGWRTVDADWRQLTTRVVTTKFLTIINDWQESARTVDNNGLTFWTLIDGWWQLTSTVDDWSRLTTTVCWSTVDGTVELIPKVALISDWDETFGGHNWQQEFLTETIDDSSWHTVDIWSTTQSQTGIDMDWWYLTSFNDWQQV